MKLQHPPPLDEVKSVSRDVVFVVTCPQDSASMWSYVYPGTSSIISDPNPFKCSAKLDSTLHVQGSVFE